MTKPDAVTRRWIRNESDQQAVEKGQCWFDEALAEYVVEWIQAHCILYEGSFAGRPLTLDDWQYDATMRLFGWQRFSDHWAKLTESGVIRRFREASIWVGKKNANSPTLAGCPDSTSFASPSMPAQNTGYG